MRRTLVTATCALTGVVGRRLRPSSLWSARAWRPAMLMGASLLLLAGALPTAAQDTDPKAFGLEALGELIIGTWEGPGSRHVHTWGVGRRLIKSESFFKADEIWELVAEGIWFWDSEDEVIRGVAVAVDMPVDRFDYRTVVDGSEVIHDLKAYGEKEEQFVETWTFGPTGYVWQLEQATEDGLMRITGGAYDRVADPEPPGGS